MECSCKVRHRHPLCRERRFQLFRWWQQKHGCDLDVTASALGVSRRTAQRWVAAKDVPLSVAMLLEQLRHGPIFQVAFGRAGGRVRSGWTPVFPQVAKASAEARERALELERLNPRLYLSGGPFR